MAGTGVNTGTRVADPVSAAIERLPVNIQEDVYRLLGFQADALARAAEVFNDDGAVAAAMAVVEAYNAALRSISETFGEPDLDMNPVQDEAGDNQTDDEPECFNGSLNIDVGSLAPSFPPFLRAQLDRRADVMRQKYNR